QQRLPEHTILPYTQRHPAQTLPPYPPPPLTIHHTPHANDYLRRPFSPPTLILNPPNTQPQNQIIPPNLNFYATSTAK
ncbi:hypothetical protein, partial [Staphylococcus epidermidis]|uniref:hypothetical protein n=1 Tax=Staphylococcus epidermidis TaxID=1282 RepID=UPI001C92D3E6